MTIEQRTEHECDQCAVSLNDGDLIYCENCFKHGPTDHSSVTVADEWSLAALEILRDIYQQVVTNPETGMEPSIPLRLRFTELFTQLEHLVPRAPIPAGANILPVMADFLTPPKESTVEPA